MKSLSTLLLIVAIALAISADLSRAQCYQHNPLNIHDKKPVPCKWVSETENIAQKVKRQTAEVIDQPNATDMFKVTFSCGISDQVLCVKVKNAFNVAGGILTSILKLSNPITVNATFVNFCTTMGECGSPQGFVTLGGAAPARSIPMTDADKVVRLYPQALVKQFDMDSHPAFGPFDIVALFNSVPNYWFQEDGTKMRNSQSDFLFVIVHELVHGLGFASSWDDYFSLNALTPDISTVTVNGQAQPRFIEFAFDQYMYIFSQNRYASDVTAILNQYSTGAGARARNIDSFARGFVSSPQFATAQQMFDFAITKNSLGFLPKGTKDPKKAVILETSLNPYAQGSSVSHVDYATYGNNPDFLMRYLQDKGVTMEDAIIAGGNYSGGPIGPQLKMVLETLGYPTQDNPNPYKPSPTNGSGNNDIGSSSNRNFERLQAMWIIAMTTILAILMAR